MFERITVRSHNDSSDRTESPCSSTDLVSEIFPYQLISNETDRESSRGMRSLRAVEATVASDTTVLILGEAGAPKELVAKAITRLKAAMGFGDEQVRCLGLWKINSDVSYGEQIGHALGLQIVGSYGRSETGTKHGGMAPFKLRKALEFINESLEGEEDISLEKVADRVGMSYSYFSRTFKLSMGISPNTYIVARRIERAKELLGSSNSSIADIALQVGFASQSHFTTMFRRLTGMTPKIFRRSSLTLGP